VVAEPVGFSRVLEPVQLGERQAVDLLLRPAVVMEQVLAEPAAPHAHRVCCG